ncbi:MAG: TonB-dependent receptor [Flavobacteriaceae bacterium]
MKKVALNFTVFLLPIFVLAQGQFLLTGEVVDGSNEDKLPFATITLRDINSKKLVGGAVTDENGYFKVESTSNNVAISVDYIGFETLVFDRTGLSKKTSLGQIRLTGSLSQLEGIDLVGRRSDVEIRLDKRVYNIGENLNARGQNVSDVLENIPSLSLDIEGNLELRGNTNVRILIDGKPSGLVGLNGIDALADLPAESIERVEVITAPSARYQAEGTSGIVNIILAKNFLEGLNGVLNTSAGRFDSYGANASINFKTNKLNFFTNSGYRDNTGKGGALQDNAYTAAQGYDRFLEERAFDRERIGTNVNVGVDFTPSDKTKLTLSYVHNQRDGANRTANRQRQYDQESIINESLRSENEASEDLNKQISLSLTQKFNDKGHRLDITIQRERNSEEEYANLQTEQLVPVNNFGPLEKNNTEELQKQFLAQVDYVLPIDKNTQFEAGYRTTNENKDVNFTVLIEDNNGNLVIDENLTNFLDFNQEIHALYTQFGKKWGSFSMLAGLRYEHTALDILQRTTNEDGKSNYGDYFPTLNLGFELSETANITFGYNRRISRPGSWSLNPFRSRSSETSFYQGNPYLKPSYSDGFDFGYLKQFKRFTINASIYFRRTLQPENRISVETGEFVAVNGLDTPVIRRYPINLGRRDQLGIEANSSLRWSPIWQTYVSFNLFSRTEIGSYEGIDFGNKNETWSGNFRNSLVLPWKINSQTNIRFSGPSRSAFGERDANASVNLAFSKDIFKENATISLNFSDIFNSSKFIYKTYTPNVITEGEYQRRRPNYSINFTYRFRQEKERSRSRNYNSDYGGGDYDI